MLLGHQNLLKDQKIVDWLFSDFYYFILFASQNWNGVLFVIFLVAKLCSAYFNICFMGPVDTGINFITRVSVCFFSRGSPPRYPVHNWGFWKPWWHAGGPAGRSGCPWARQHTRAGFQTPIGLRVIWRTRPQTKSKLEAYFFYFHSKRSLGDSSRQVHWM